MKDKNILPQPYLHASHSHTHANIYHCDLCGRNGHLAKFCFYREKLLKNNNSNVSHKMGSHAHSHDHISSYAQPFHCGFCGRDGHLEEFCFDKKKVLKNKNPFVSKDVLQTLPHTHVHKHAYGSKFANGYFCDYCGKNGHIENFCFYKIKLINAPSWGHIPKFQRFPSF